MRACVGARTHLAAEGRPPSAIRLDHRSPKFTSTCFSGATSSLRRSPPEAVSGSGGEGGLRRYDDLIVVEGLNDMRAVRRAVHADVFVLGTATKAGDAETLSNLRNAAGARGGGIVVLTDPDVAGRQARNILDERLGGCWHAFVPVPLARARAAVKSKKKGNIGVEHAAPGAIQRALATVRRSNAARAVFTREDLQKLGLIAVVQERGGKVTERRLLVCDFLGTGTSDGKQLLRQLNRYNFSLQDLQAALRWADAQLGAVGAGN